MKWNSALLGLSAGILMTLGSQAANAACKSDELSLRWPMGGTDAVDWVINNYVDLDSGKGLRDYRNNTGDLAKTYNGHGGIDVDLSTFRNMDVGVPVFAAAAGTVVNVQSNLFDRNFVAAPGCGDWNHVEIKHANGYRTFYGHLRQNGVQVKVGDNVTSGQRIGLVGSSGCSSTAHLHFEVRNCSNAVVEPFQDRMFVSAPVYDTAHRLMDLSVRKGEFPDPRRVTPPDAILKDPPINETTFAAGARIGIGLSTAGGGVGDRVEVLVRRPDGTVLTSFNPIVYTVAQRHGWPRWWTSLPNTVVPGAWKVEVRLDSRLVRTHQFQMVANRDAILQGLPDTTYQQTFQSLTGDSYRPVFIDGQPFTGGAVFSAIYRRESGQFRAFHNLEAAQYQTEFNAGKAANLQLLSVDSYVRDGKVLMAGVFGTPMGGKWEAYHQFSNADHMKRFNHLKDHGMRPYAISVVKRNGQELISAAYTDQKSTGWTARHNMTVAEYQAEFDAQVKKGRGPAYVKAYNDAGTPRFSAIWTVEAAQGGRFYGRHNLDEKQFFQFNEARVLEGFRAVAITTYVTGGRRLYAGIWSTKP